MPVERTFSFESHDEGALSHNVQEGLCHQPPYHDESPSRDIVSPPPLYSSPPPPEPVPTVSPTPAAGRYHPRSQMDRTIVSNIPAHDYSRRGPVSQPQDDAPPPPPPPHRSIPFDDGHYNQDFEDSRAYKTPSTVPSGMDNFSDGVRGGGTDNLARGVADQRHRESGVEAQRAMDAAALRQSDRSPQLRQSHSGPERQMPTRPSETRLPEQRSSYSSNIPLAAGAATPGSITPDMTPNIRSSRYSGRSIQMEDYPRSGYPGNYHDTPYLNAGTYNATVSDANINPYDIADDGDDGFFPEPKRRSRYSSRNQSRERVTGDNQSSSGGSAIAGSTGAGTAAGAIGGIFGRNQRNQVPSGSYDPVQQGYPNAENHEKDDWKAREKAGNKRRGLIVGSLIGLVIVLAIIGGAVGGVLGNRSSNSGSSDNSASGDTAANGDLDLNSPEIQALMNNPDLHKVFPGMDYTPWGTQYPLCLTYPPSQNNVTRDMAVLSQLTNAVRLYGTDCNQTEMVLHSIERLKLTDMKVWLGVWIDTNQTTTDRQISQMYKILEETNDRSIFKGAIIGNEALYRAGEDKAQSEAELIAILTSVKEKYTSLGYDIPVATSDLGDNWNGQLVEAVDIVMSNIHPFFAGVTASTAAAWTLNFWQTHDLVLTGSGTGTDTGKKQIISETGWPSSGGTDCGGATGACATGQSGSVAGVAGMNTFMEAWVCPALANGTDYFWFEAFDEPWKIIYDTETQNWEDKWGLMDPARNLKSGLKIPDCGGKTVS